MPTILKLSKLRLTESKRGFLIRFINAAGVDTKKQVPKGVDPHVFAVEQNALFELGDYGVKSNGMTFDQAVVKFHTSLDEMVWREKTNAKYGDRMRPHHCRLVKAILKNHFQPVLGSQPLKHIKPWQIKGLQTDLSKKLSPQVVNSYLSVLGSVFTMCYEKGWMETNPVSLIKNLQAKASKQGYTPTKDEVEAVISAAPDDWRRTMIMLAANTGLRCSEVIALTWQAISGDVISVEKSAVFGHVGKPKNETSRRKIRIDSKLKLRLAAMRLASTGDFLFINKNGNLYSGTDATRQVLDPAIKIAGVQRFGWHGFRRFYENELDDQGKRKEHIQKLMGHQIGSQVTDKHYRVVREEAVMTDDYVLSIG